MERKSRKFLVLFLVCVLMAGMVLSGCGRPGSDPTPTEATKTPNRPVIGGRGEMTPQEAAAYCENRVVRVNADGAHGSGFFIDDQGTLVTNYHVIEGSKNLAIQFDDGATYQVKSIVDFNPFCDIAVLRADITGNDYFTISDVYSKGETIYVCGYPKNVGAAAFNSGLLSQTSEQLGLMDCFLTDAAVNNGNSGGPALNVSGEVLGICSYVRNDAQNMSYAIKMSMLDILKMDKNFNMNRYQEWYNKEIGRSYMAIGSDGYYDTYVNTYTVVTGVDCNFSTDDGSKGQNGYAIKYLFYQYDYDMESYDKYCEYLNSIGFQYNETIRQMGLEGVSYIDTFNGYEMIILTDTINNQLLISCPIL